MPCFYVLVHGRIRWIAREALAEEVQTGKPAGFYCDRYVLARDQKQAEMKAFRRVTDNLRQFDWLTGGLASLELEAETVSVAPIRKLLKPDNKGHTFYNRE